jgi:Tol biopolymer transport system component
MNATWSPLGDAFAFTSVKYNGIWTCDATGGNIQKITSDQNAGFGYRWSSDGHKILARPVLTEQNKRYHQVKLYDVPTGDEKVLLSKTRSMKGLPVWIEEERKVAITINGEIKRVETGMQSLKGERLKHGKAVKFGEMVISVSSEMEAEEVSFSQFEGRYIFNRRVSPNGRKIVFEVNGLGLFVSHVNGTDLKHLGFGEHASWMPDNRYVIVTIVEDDGYNITSGNLFSVDTVTGEYHPLYHGDAVVALKPSVAPDGKKILFDNLIDGSIYLLNIE